MNEEALAPVFRVADTAAAVAWYQRLGFVVGYEHASGPAFNRTTVALSRGELVLILSNREEDGHAGGLAVMRVSDVSTIAGKFGIEINDTCVARHIELRDPDGNRIRIVTPKFAKEPRPA
jgi:catechol 2,3-dioxygenase-like lactoylglutathione lyase family enzyme